MCFINPISILIRLFFSGRSRKVMMPDTGEETPVFFDLETTGLRPVRYTDKSLEKISYGKVMMPDTGEETPVFFDLETTGLNTSACDIVQLSAISSDKAFNAYMLPRCCMTDGAARVTGLTVDGDALLRHRRPVRTTPQRQALINFIYFLKTFNRPFLVGHNSRRFDWPILMRVMKEFGLLEDFGEVVSGCVDTLTMSREMFHLEKYNQPFLVKHFLGESYGAHDATEDARTLQDLYRVWKPCKALVMKHKSFM